MIGDKWADSPKGFWALIGLTILFGIAYLFGAKKLIDWTLRKMTEE
jgi:hypothetical protein